MGRRACTEPQCLCKGTLYLLFFYLMLWARKHTRKCICQQVAAVFVLTVVIGNQNYLFLKELEIPSEVCLSYRAKGTSVF